MKYLDKQTIVQPLRENKDERSDRLCSQVLDLQPGAKPVRAMHEYRAARVDSERSATLRSMPPLQQTVELRGASHH